MLTAQMCISFAVWIAAGIVVGRRISRAGPLRYGRSAAIGLGSLLFVLSAIVLVGGLVWIARDGGSIKVGFTPSIWIAITGLGVLFTVGQAEAAGLVMRSIIRQEPVTNPTPEPSSSSDHLTVESNP